MKNFLLTLMVMITFVACNNDQNAEVKNRDIQLLADSTVYRNNNIYSDTMATVVSDKTQSEKSNTPVVAENPRVPVNNAHQKSNKDQVYTSSDNSKVAPPVATPPITNSPGVIDSAKNKETTAIGDSKESNKGVETAPVPEKKKGWNKATQGAVIGGAAGAVGGAIISKKKGLGAVIGGVVGAAGGYILGKKADKKADSTAKDQK
ncbi:MAG: glycine zipper domain-containing protein [Ginsengibacter sp.]